MGLIKRADSKFGVRTWVLDWMDWIRVREWMDGWLVRSIGEMLLANKKCVRV